MVANLLSCRNNFVKRDQMCLNNFNFSLNGTECTLGKVFSHKMVANLLLVRNNFVKWEQMCLNYFNFSLNCTECALG